jgi:ribosomal protein S18 acetylase RimI-like enzyme
VNRPGLVLVAEADGELVGFVAAEERRHWCGDRGAYVGELVVAHKAEGRGVGRALMGAVTEWAGDRRIPHVTLETGAANQAARAFYQRLGFQEEDVRLTLAVKRPG